MPSKKTSKKKTAAKKTVTKKVAAKKVAQKKTATKKTAAKKAVGKKAAAKKTPAKKAASPVKKKASDFIKRPSHTPAIFKTASKKPIPILFTMEDVEELLKKRKLEEKAEEKPKKKAAKKAAKNAVQPLPEIPAEEPKNSKHVAASLDDILGLGGGSVSPVSPPGKAPRKWQKYHKLLIELRDQMREELNMHSKDTLKRSPKEDSGDISTSVDAGTDNFDRDFALSLLSSEQEALNEIEAALKRIQNGTYGVCEETGEPINAERLEAVPFTRFSLEGQRQFESTTIRRESKAGAFLNEATGEAISFGDDDGDN